MNTNGASAPAIDPRNYAHLAPGDLAPWFRQRCAGNPAYAFDTAAGRWIVLCFYGSAADDEGKAALAAVLEKRALFDDLHLSFFGVSADAADEAEKRIADAIPGIRHFLDFDGSVCRLYGAAPKTWRSGPVALRRMWMVLDPALRVHAVIPFQPGGGERATLFALIAKLPQPGESSPVAAPILMLPNVFEPEFCRRLIALYETHGGQDSGFMREQDGKTIAILDYAHKRRRDYVISDEAIIRYTQACVLRRVAPQIQRAHQFEVTRMERYIVACYDAAEEAHFRPHRDNTTRGTAHRRFAVSINLNADFEGGDISFPEYGSKAYKPPPGAAVVFSCSLLHAVAPVTRGKRYAFLPFLYDDAAAHLRQENNAFLGEGVGKYQAGPPPKSS
jgi:predicted 2-oxoglutarate/Fe(II)-dependent dioxygenase YbiX/peroxiredoxin